MQAWSDNPIHPNFTVKIFVDTNILAYLVDITYESLNDFINAAKDSKFVELVSSKYVIFEFVGIRKKEHYLRKVAALSKLSSKGEINFSSLLKFQNVFSAPEAPFDTVIPDIKKEVEEELERIARDFKINFEYSVLHEDQLKPTFEICLSTKISNQDCLVLISSVIPSPSVYTNHLELLTNDTDFVSSFNHTSIDQVFATYSIKKPSVSHISSILGDSGSIHNLKEVNDIEKIHLLIKSMIQRHLLEKNKELFLGITFKPTSASFPDNIICFKLNKGILVRRNIYITVIGKDFDFIYTSKKKVVALHHNSSELAEGYISPSDSKINVAYKLVDAGDDGSELMVDKQIIDAIRTDGNFVFIHPDS